MLAQVVVPAAAQTALPALGDGVEMSLSAERQLGDRIARELYRNPAYLDDPVLGEYVQDIWQHLLQAARQRGELSPELDERFAWQVLLGRNRSVNALTFPGAYMVVYLGLIAVASNEDELASVLAHELSHVTQRHIARILSRQGEQAPWRGAAGILGFLVAIFNPNAGVAMIMGGQAAAEQSRLNFSRDMEREADRVGYGVMTQAGYEGRGFVSLFEKLQQANRFNDTGAFPYLLSHPLPTERMADMQARLQLQARSEPSPALTMAHAMPAARARMLANPEVDSLRTALAQAEGAPAVARSPAEQAGVLYAGVMGAMGLKEFSRAQRLLERLQQATAAEPKASYQTRLLGPELALAAGDPQRAGGLLPPMNTTATKATSRPLLFLRARAWTQTGKAQQAAEQLQVWLAAWPRDAQAWQLLSAAYTAQGLMLRAVRAEAEVHAAQLDYAAARDRLRAAQELARQAQPVDHIEASIIDARSREVELALREQMLQR